MNLVQTIKNLHRYVLSYKVDNDRLIKYKEYQCGINIKMLQILDIIEKKLDKDIQSSKLKSQWKNIEVLVYINITHQDSQLEGNTSVQFHLFSESILEGLG
jgi:hypothetical protein